MSNEGSPDPTEACASCLPRRSLLLGAVGAVAGFATTVVPDAAVAAPGRWTTLGPASDVPLGSGRFYALHGGAVRYVVTRPRRGEWRAFTGRCPHEGGNLRQFPPRQIQCDFHGSRFWFNNGHFISGPEPNIPDLKKYEVRVRSGSVQVR